VGSSAGSGRAEVVFTDLGEIVVPEVRGLARIAATILATDGTLEWYYWWYQ